MLSYCECLTIVVVFVDAVNFVFAFNFVVAVNLDATIFLNEIFVSAGGLVTVILLLRLVLATLPLFPRLISLLQSTLVPWFLS